jgi:hypothetical protein
LGFFSCLCLPKGKKKDKGCLLWMVQIKSGHPSDGPDQIWSPSDDPDQIRLALDGPDQNLVGFWCPQIKSSRLWMAEIKSGHPQVASFGCCALLMDEQIFSWEFLHWRERRRIRVARGRIP